MGGGGGGGGEYEGECVFHDDHDNDEYNDDNKYDEEEDGKGSHGGADDGGESDYDGRDVICGPSFGSVGQRKSIVGPHAAAAVINDNKDNDCRHSGGASYPPTSGSSRPARCRSSSLMSPTAVNGGGTRAFEAW